MLTGNVRKWSNSTLVLLEVSLLITDTSAAISVLVDRMIPNTIALVMISGVLNAHVQSSSLQEVHTLVSLYQRVPVKRLCSLNYVPRKRGLWLWCICESHCTLRSCTGGVTAHNKHLSSHLGVCGSYDP